MNILTDILGLFKRKKFRNHVKPDDVLVIGISEEPDIEGIASPVPYKDVKLVKYKDFLASAECENINVPILDPNPGIFKDTTTDPISGDCFDNFRRLKSLSLNLTIAENGDFIEFDNLGEPNTASNVGGGAECFKQKVGEDLEFRTLTSTDGSVTITENTDTIDLSSGAVSGVWSRVDAAGTLTYYPLYSDAIAAASSGETITLHTNYDLSTGAGFNLKNGVNINLNGFTLTYSNTDTSSAFTDSLTGMIKTRIYNGIVVRENQNVPGNFNDTLVLELVSGSIVECENVKFINDDGWGVYINDGTLTGASIEADQGGIALGQDYYLRDCYAFGANQPGLSTVGSAKNTLVVNCTGQSSDVAGISLSSTEVVNCVGIHSGSGQAAGVYLNGCKSVGIKGYSITGSGVIIEGGMIDGCHGRTSAIIASAGYMHAGVQLINILLAQDVHGFSDGDPSATGMTVVREGTALYSRFVNCSGVTNIVGTTGLTIVVNNAQDTNKNILTFENCSASGNIRACELDSSNSDPAYENVITMFNCSFNTDANNGICIEGTNTNKLLAYANCVFRTGEDSAGTPLVDIIQTITNTPDLQGNMYA